MSEPFTVLTATAAPLPLENADTDLIWPAGPKISLRRGEQAPNLFATLRYESDGREKEDFILNREPWRHARILVTGRNFGCGSSREMAVWSLVEWGLRAIVAPSFGDIFFNNACLNGLLPVVLPEPAVRALLALTSDPQSCTLTVDLERLKVIGTGFGEHFELDPHRRECLLRGLDETAFTLTLAPRIAAFGQRYARAFPWAQRALSATEDA